MARRITVGAAQLGAIQKADSRTVAVDRMLALMAEGHRRGVELIVFPELALTTFFPRHYVENLDEADHWYEAAMPSNETAPLFEAARKYRMGFHLGYAELTHEADETGVERKRRFNTAILVNPDGRIVLKYRKVHLPGHAEPQPGRAHQHLEKRYFEPGNLGFPVFRGLGGVMGMCICNDRRWPETYRVMGLQGVEMIMLGYNTPFDHTGYPEIDGLTSFHNHLSMQAGAYQNATWVIGAAKCGKEEGSNMLGQSVIVAPSGEIVAQALTLEDEIIIARCDLDFGNHFRETIFNFAKHREPDAYRLIVERKGAVPPPA